MSKSPKETAVGRAVYTVAQYCARNQICRATLYNLWREGDGPARMKFGNRTMISVEAEDEYRRRQEARHANAAE